MKQKSKKSIGNVNITVWGCTGETRIDCKTLLGTMCFVLTRSFECRRKNPARIPSVSLQIYSKGEYCTFSINCCLNWRPSYIFKAVHVLRVRTITPVNYRRVFCKPAVALWETSWKA